MEEKKISFTINAHNELVLHTSHKDTQLTKTLCLDLIQALQQHIFVLNNYNLKEITEDNQLHTNKS